MIAWTERKELIGIPVIAGFLIAFGQTALANDAQPPQLRLPQLSDPDLLAPQVQPCENTRDANNCARTLACIGNTGLWFEGEARGWNAGTLEGRMSDGTSCTGDWAYGDILNTATATLICEDGTTARLIYYAQDPLTGTGQARGIDNRVRSIRAWTGLNVLEFLTPEGQDRPILPCTETGIPIS